MIDDNCRTGATLKKESQILQEINHLANAMDTLTGRITLLGDRLIPVLRKDLPPPVDGKDDQSECELVLHASGIRQVRYQIERQASILVSILDRLET